MPTNVSASTVRKRVLRIGIIVGEPSGDNLGASLIEALRGYYPQLRVEGIAGPQLKAAGCHVLFSMDPLSIIGLFEPLMRLKELLRIRRDIKAHFLTQRPEVLIAVDAPAFNLNVEETLHRAGIKTVHYVSPTIWAWKKRRIYKIKRAVDLILCLLPFEPPIYEKHQVAAKFVGHPLADEIPLEVDQQAARMQLGFAENDRLLAMLPGSRGSELKHLTVPFLNALKRCRQQLPELKVVVPLVNGRRRQQFEHTLKHYLKKYFPQQGEDDFSALGITLIDGQARVAMAAADAVLLSSGTATLEAMLLKRPMVVAYRFNFFNALLIRLLVRVKFISWPNLLANQALVPELIQYRANGRAISHHLMKIFRQNNQPLITVFTTLHQKLRQQASQQAAKAIVALIEKQEVNERQ